MLKTIISEQCEHKGQLICRKMLTKYLYDKYQMPLTIQSLILLNDTDTIVIKYTFNNRYNTPDNKPTEKFFNYLDHALKLDMNQLKSINRDYKLDELI